MCAKDAGASFTHGMNLAAAAFIAAATVMMVVVAAALIAVSAAAAAATEQNDDENDPQTGAIIVSGVEAHRISPHFSILTHSMRLVPRRSLTIQIFPQRNAKTIDSHRFSKR